MQTVSWLPGLSVATVPPTGMHSEVQLELSMKYGGGNFGEVVLASTPVHLP